MRKTVAFGFVGTVLDYAGRGSQRWSKWRPTLCLCQQESLVIDRLELLHDARSRSLFETLKRDIASVSPETEVVGVEIELHNPWDFEEVYACLHDFARGYAFQPEKEDYLIHITTGTHVAQICWFLLAEARYLPARLIQSSPPRKKERPDSPGAVTIIDLDLSRYNAIASRFAEERQQTLDFLKSGIATRNSHFNRMIEQIEKVAIKSRAPILLNGPTGAGKSFLARRIFELKQARHQFSGAFVEVNCATLRGDTAMSTLFGHVKGAFTGARESREGLLRSANGGMLFLDEIGELGADEQAMLLKAIEEKTFYPFGSDRQVSSDFQLIAGTVRDLRQLVAEGKFREDLYARINLWTFTLPGLRQRQEDIEPNLDYEVERHASLTGDSVRFNTEARRAWLAFATSPRQHGAVTFANFLPASRGWPPLPLADASHWIRWKMRSTVCAITGRRVAPPRLRRCWAQRQKTSISSTVCNWNTLSLSAARQSRFLLPDVNCLTFRARVKPASMTRIGYANTWRVLV